MKYTSSEHYKEDPFEEVGSALAAGNSVERVRATYEARRSTESMHIPPDTEAIQRIEQQLAHIASLGAEVETAA